MGWYGSPSASSTPMTCSVICSIHWIVCRVSAKCAGGTPDELCRAGSSLRAQALKHGAMERHAVGEERAAGGEHALGDRPLQILERHPPGLTDLAQIERGRNGERRRPGHDMGRPIDALHPTGEGNVDP